MCGLKQLIDFNTIDTAESHPSWVCGLKQYQVQKANMAFIVTPLVGVWIETNIIIPKYRNNRVTPLVGVWIETIILFNNTIRNACHTPRGCVD